MTDAQLQLSQFLIDKSDTDVYLLFMGQVIRKRFPNLEVEYEFIHRSSEPFPKGFAKKLQILVDQMAELKVDQKTVQFLESHHPYITSEFLSWWQNQFQFNPAQLSISQHEAQLQIKINGLWSETIYWETPLLALISELYNVAMDRKPEPHWQVQFGQKLQVLAEALTKQHTNIKISEFGTRRRYGLLEHAQVLYLLQQHLGSFFAGTSNLHFAQQFQTRPVGTIAHQFIMGMSAVYGLENANQKTLQIWHEEYGSHLQTALTDTYTHQLFFQILGQHLSEFQSFKTFRHDSGDPYAYIQLVSAFLKKHQQNPQIYTILFSDAVMIEQIQNLSLACQQIGISVAFGVGNNFTHAATGIPALDIVIKPVRFILPNGVTTAVTKLAEDSLKTSGENAEATRKIITALLKKNAI